MLAVWAEGRVRITAQLIEGATDQHLWADDYERTVQDVFALQAEVARAIAGQVNVAVTPEVEEQFATVPTTVPEAYDEYLRGRYQLARRTESTILRSIEHFQRVLELDSTFASAWSGLSDALQVLPEYAVARVDEWGLYRESEAAAIRAIELRPDLADGHSSLAGARWSLLDWAGAEEGFERAIRLQPSHTTAQHWYSMVLSQQGRHEEALQRARSALELDPLSLILGASLGRRLHEARRHEEARVELRRVLELDDRYAVAWFILGLAFLAEDAFAEAADAMARWSQATGRDADVSRRFVELVEEHRRGGIPAPLPADWTADPPYQGRNLGAVLALLGHTDQAVDWLVSAYDEHPTAMAGLASPEYDTLRPHAGFAALLERVGLQR